jgi:omega-6 fatty acid desaturase (delta-12 desaturase)
VLFGYATIFAVTICLMPLLRDPKQHGDSALSVLAHGGLVALLWSLGGFELAFFTLLLPMAGEHECSVELNPYGRGA